MVTNQLSQTGCVAKNHLGHKNTERYFSSGSNLEELGHESNLSANVAFPDSFNLSLPDHVHGLISTDGSPLRVETEEAQDCSGAVARYERLAQELEKNWAA
jgi:hypothetical protein